MVQRVASDGQEDIEKRVISTERQHDKVEGVHQPAFFRSSLGVNSIVHDLVPVLTSKNLGINIFVVLINGSISKLLPETLSIRH